METIEILKRLISIPSWVDAKTNEREIGEWIFEFLKENSNLKLSKQPIGNGRFNIIAQKSRKVDILVTGHIDTVQPNSEWTASPTEPKVIGDKMFGRGTSDMKCGVAIMLYLATLPGLKENTMFLFYCDEEYDFLGMKKFMTAFKKIASKSSQMNRTLTCRPKDVIKLYAPCKVVPYKVMPKLIISLDGDNLQIGNSCRGLIEINVSVQGKAGHAANPKSGINAITESMKVIEKLKIWLTDFSSKELGNSTLNIAYINGGGGQGNIIAEKCEYIIEIRVANQELNANLVGKFVTENSEKLGLKVKEIKVKHDLGSWITSEKDLKDIISASPKKKIQSAKKSGYIDIQMLWETFGKAPTFSLGAGETGQAHKADEFVKIPDVLRAQKFFQTILTNEAPSAQKTRDLLPMLRRERNPSEANSFAEGDK